MQNVTTLLFDLGGVLIELGSVEEMMAGSPYDSATIWDNWIRHPAVISFESGRCGPEVFARRMVDDFKLPISPGEFLTRFNAWPKQTYRGATDLLSALAPHYQLVCLSNTNAAHYESFLLQQPVIQHFDCTFFSHLTGCLKPDAAAFNQVLDALGLPPDNILFFDDNPGNIQAAMTLGFPAEQVNAPSDVVDALNRRGLGPAGPQVPGIL